jgi:serine/threonine-protein phosphatase 6 catalytic subunit
MSTSSGLDLDACIAQLKTCKYLPENTLLSLCSILCNTLLEEGTIHSVQSPVTIAGDIHGQFWDLIELLRKSDVSETEITNYIFMGDFVDRGYYSLETVSLLFALKAR